MGKNLAMTAFEMFGMHIKANPKYGSEKKGLPTTYYLTCPRAASAIGTLESSGLMRELETRLEDDDPYLQAIREGWGGEERCEWKTASS